MREANNQEAGCRARVSIPSLPFKTRVHYASVCRAALRPQHAEKRKKRRGKPLKKSHTMGGTETAVPALRYPFPEFHLSNICYNPSFRTDMCGLEGVWNAGALDATRPVRFLRSTLLDRDPTINGLTIRETGLRRHVFHEALAFLQAVLIEKVFFKRLSA